MKTRQRTGNSLQVITSILSAFTIVILSSSCGSTQKIERDRVGRIGKVAIIGFGLQQMRSGNGEDVVNAILGSEKENVKGAPIAVPSELAAMMYSDLRKQIAQQTGWMVMDQNTLRSHPAYQKLYQQRTKQPQMRPWVRDRVEAFIPEGIIEAFLLETLSPEDRNALMAELGVDGVVTVTVFSDLTNEANVFQKMIAKGKFHRSVGVRFAAFDRAGKDPVWFDGKAREESQEGIDHGLGFSDPKKLDELSLATTRKVFSKVSQSYKTL